MGHPWPVKSFQSYLPSNCQFCRKNKIRGFEPSSGNLPGSTSSDIMPGHSTCSDKTERSVYKMNPFVYCIFNGWRE